LASVLGGAGVSPDGAAGGAAGSAGVVTVLAVAPPAGFFVSSVQPRTHNPKVERTTSANTFFIDHLIVQKSLHRDSQVTCLHVSLPLHVRQDIVPWLTTISWKNRMLTRVGALFPSEFLENVSRAGSQDILVESRGGYIVILRLSESPR
jgi:hypothetical protein